MQREKKRDNDPYAPGPFRVDPRTVEAHDFSRDLRFPCEIWRPAEAPSPLPLVLYSHHSGGNRRAATYLCEHLSSHGYMVAAMDHSDVVAKDLARPREETPDQKNIRMARMIASRVPDIRFLLGYLLATEPDVDPARIGIVGHSFGGWTALAAPETMDTLRAVVALAPGGSTLRKPGMLPLELNFHWKRDVPTLYIVAENDVSLPLAGMQEVFARTPGTKQMLILPRADHLHFLDNAEQQHEAVRKMPFTGELAWINQEMRPIAELSSGEEAHRFIRGHTLIHLDAYL